MANNQNNGKKAFAPNIGFWPAKSGNGYTLFVGEGRMEEVQKFMDNIKPGCMLHLSKNKSDNEKAPTFRLTVLPPKDESDGL